MDGVRWLMRKRVLLPVAVAMAAAIATLTVSASASTGAMSSWSSLHADMAHRVYLLAPAGAPLPTAATTGVRSGTNLSTVTGDYRAVAGETVTAKLITGDFIAAPNVTLVNSHVLGRIVSRSTGLSLVDDDIGPSACPAQDGDNQLIAGPFNALRVHFHSGVGDDLIRLTAGTTSITDSLIDQTCYYPGNHLDAIQFYDPGTVANVTIQHSVVDVTPVNSTEQGNSAIFWADQPDPASTLTVRDSYLAGGNYTVALYDAGTITLTGNIFARGSSHYGPCVKNLAVTFQNNTYQDGGAVTC